MQSTLQARVVFVGESSLGALGLQTCLTEAGHVIEAAVRSRRSALAAIDASDANLVIIGTMRPPERAFGLCREVSKRWPEIPIIITCWGLDDDLLVADAVYVGASACVDACIEPRDLVEVVERVLVGGVLFTSHQLRFAHSVEPLTPRQIDVLRLAIRSKTNSEVATNLSVAPNTIRNIVSEARSKLGVSTTRDAAIRAERRGMLD